MFGLLPGFVPPAAGGGGGGKITFAYDYTGQTDGIEVPAPAVELDGSSFEIAGGKIKHNDGSYGILGWPITANQNSYSFTIWVEGQGGSSYFQFGVRGADENNVICLQRNGSNSEKLRVYNMVASSIVDDITESTPTTGFFGGCFVKITFTRVAGVTTVRVYIDGDGMGYVEVTDVALTLTNQTVADAAATLWYGINTGQSGARANLVTAT